MHTDGLNDNTMEIITNNKSVKKSNFDNNNQLIEWTREKTLKLLNEYKNRRVLWDWNNRGYRDRIKRKLAIQELANLFNCNTLEIEKKITNLKCQYSREVHKIQNSQEQSNSPDDIYVSKWFAYKSMQFLQFGTRKYSSRKKKVEKEKQEEEYLVSDIDPESIKYEDDDDDDDDENESGAESRNPSINEDIDDETTNSSFNLRASQLYNISMSNDCNALSQNNDENCENIVNNDNKITDGKNVREDIVKFGESIACQLSQIPDPYSRSVAKLKINQILFEAEIGVYAQGRR